MSAKKELTVLTRITPAGARRDVVFSSNSGAVKRHQLKQRERVVWSGGTKVGGFRDK